MNVKKPIIKVAKLSLVISLFILLLAFFKSFLQGEIGNLTLMGFLEAILVSIATGTLAAVALYIKDESDKNNN